VRTIETLSLADIMKHAIEEGDCLLWTGSAAGGKHPQIRMGGKAGAVVGVRRVLFEAVHGRPIRVGFQAGVRCGVDLCVHPDCIVERPRAEAMKRARLGADHPLRVAAGKQAKSRLSLETIRAIRASKDLCKVIDARYGLSAGYASRIRTGRVWVDLTNPFAGLGARA
jgi:hypothetical protein